MNATWLDSLVTPWRRSSVEKVAATRPDVRFMRLGPAMIRYRLAGTGPVTVAICADPPVVLELYDELLALLAEDFRVVAFEVPAFGFSLPRLGIDFGLEPMTDLIGEFLERLGFGPYVLAFPCVPAYSALRLAGARPDLVSGLAVMQAAGWDEELRWKERRDPKGLLSRPFVGQLAMRALRRRRAGEWYRAALGRGELLERFTGETRKAFDRGAAFGLASAFQRYLAGPVPDFGPARPPCLAVWGDADRSHARTDKESIRQHLPDARIARFPRAGHFPELEEPALFAAELRASFLR